MHTHQTTNKVEGFGFVPCALRAESEIAHSGHVRYCDYHRPIDACTRVAGGRWQVKHVNEQAPRPTSSEGIIVGGLTVNFLPVAYYIVEMYSSQYSVRSTQVTKPPVPGML